MADLDILLKDIKIKTELTSSHDSHRKQFGKGSRSCRACFTHTGLIRSYNIMLCRRCFREYAKDIGFKQYD